MKANRGKDTKPELAVRKALHRSGLRYRTNYAPLTDHRRLTGDIVFTRQRIVVLIDGCFWHQCPLHFVMPKSNVGYWGSKIAANVERDLRSTELMRDAGWRVMRFWEHEDPEGVARRVAETVRATSVTPSERS
jgi:DNA mismatch endonuclease (patch repair protein)